MAAVGNIVVQVDMMALAEVKWEYMVVDLAGSLGIEIQEGHVFDEGAIERWLDERGAEGWELMHISASLRTYFLKRVCPFEVNKT